MGLIASKFAFLPPNPPGPLHVDCQFIKTLNGHEIPIYFKKHPTSANASTCHAKLVAKPTAPELLKRVVAALA